MQKFNRITTFTAGWSSLVARRAHNPKVVGSNPAPATNLKKVNKTPYGVFCLLMGEKSVLLVMFYKK